MPKLPVQIEVIGDSEPFLSFLDMVSRAATVNRPVLLTGERGTGKELAAARLHYHSDRWQGPFLTLNCAAPASSLLESELFGHEAGAFTGAQRQRRGLFETADGGTLFLDEISLMPLPLQEKILRVVEYGVFERVGGTNQVSVDVRIIGATNRDLPEMAARGEFKSDLLDRLSFLVITPPPLRSRGDDILLLADHFRTRMAIELGLNEAPDFSDHAIRQLQSHRWPGNVRELKNTVERAVFQCDDETIHTVQFDPFDSPWRKELSNSTPVVATAVTSTATQTPVEKPAKSTTDFSIPLLEAREQLELDYMRHALEQTRWNQKEAATLLCLTYHQFRNLYRRLKPMLLRDQPP